MTKGKLLLLGILSYVPAFMFLYFIALMVYFTTGFADPDEPLPVVGLVELLFITMSLLIGVALASYFATLPVVKPEERVQVAVFLLGVLPLALPWFWYTKLWPTAHQGPKHARKSRR